MKRRGLLKIVLILAGTLILPQCRPPAPVSAAVEFAPGVGEDAVQPGIKELEAAFNEAKAAVKQADVYALMTFYSTAYNYHGLNRSDVSQVSDQHSHRAASSHRAVGKTCQLAWICGVDSPVVPLFLPMNPLLGASFKCIVALVNLGIAKAPYNRDVIRIYHQP